MADDDRAWLPTHLQQAEEVLDKAAPAPVKRTEKRTTVKRERKGFKWPKRRTTGKARTASQGTGPSHLAEARIKALFTQGKTYNLSWTNALDGTTRSLKGARFKEVDGHGTLWFIDKAGKGRYIRPLAVIETSVKEAK